MSRLKQFNVELYREFLDNFDPIVYNGEEIVKLEHAQYFLSQHIDKYFIDSHVEEVTDLNAINLIWGHFIGAYKKMLTDSYDTLQLEYDPLENYNGIIETTHGQHNETMITGKREGTSDTTTHPYGYNSDTYSNSEKINGNFSNEQATDQHEFSEYRVLEKKHGNLGVTTSQQMVTSQLQLDQYNLIKWFFDLFAYENLFYM